MNGLGIATNRRREDRAERGPEPSSLLRLPPHVVVQLFCELFRDELDHRSAHNLPVQDLRRYYRNLFLGNGAPSPLGIYGYASRLADSWTPVAAMGQNRCFLPCWGPT
jgi:hypothetical protein